MPVYKVQAPNGKIYDVEGPENADENMLFGVVQQQLDEEDRRRKMRQYGPGYLETFGRSVARGTGQLLSTATDIIPAAVGSALGFEDYAKEQLAEAEQKRAEREAKYPTLFRSYKEIEGIGDFAKFATETVGEQLANIATSLVPGVGVGALAGRSALTGATKKLAAEAAEKGLVGEAAEQFIKQGQRALPVTSEAAKATLRGQTAGAYLGSYALNAPEVFQNIYEETGELAPGAAALFGSVSAALDAILPAQLAKQIAGPTKAAIVGKVLENSGMEKGLARSLTAGILKGVAGEGLTEGAQEAISISAEKFVGDNPQIFGSKEWDRIVESAVKGAVAGGAFGGVGGGVQGLRERAEVKRQEAEQARIRGEEERAQQLEAEAARIEQEAEAASAQIEALQRPTTEAEQEAYGVEAQAGPFSPAMPYGPVTSKEYKAQEAQFKKDRQELTKLLQELAPEKLDLVGLAERPPAIEQTLQKAGEPLEKLQERGMRKGELNLEEMRRVGWNEEWNTLIPNIAELAQPEFRKALTSDVTIPVETRKGIIESAKQLTLPDGKPIIPKTARYSYPDASSTKIDDLRKISKDVFGVAPNAAIMRDMAGRDIANPEDALFVRDTLDAFANSDKAPVGAADKIEKFLQLPQFKVLEGAPSATGIDEQAGREGAGVSGKRGRRTAPAPVESTKRGGVDVVGGDADELAGGETAEPGALKTRPQAAPTPATPQLTPEQEAARAEAEFLGEEQVPIEERGAMLRRPGRKQFTPEEARAVEKEATEIIETEAPVKPIPSKTIRKLVNEFFGEHYLDPDKKLYLPKYQGPAFDKIQAQFAEAGDLNGLLRNLLDSNPDPAIKQVLRRIRSLNLKTKLEIGDPSTGVYFNQFYSALTKAVDQLPTKSATPDNWKNAIRGLVNKGTVKFDEMFWTGVEDWLDSRIPENKLSKEEVLNYLNTRGVRVSMASSSRYASFNVDKRGGKNSANYILYLPEIPFTNKEVILRDAYDKEIATLKENTPLEFVFDGIRGPNLPIHVRALAGPASDPDDNKTGYIPASDISFSQSKKFISSHWPEFVNALGHFRLTERYDPDGKKVLFVEEIQSDWAQKVKTLLSAADANKREETAKKLEALKDVAWEEHEILSSQYRILYQSLQESEAKFRQEFKKALLAGYKTKAGVIRAFLNQELDGVYSDRELASVREENSQHAFRQSILWEYNGKPRASDSPVMIQLKQALDDIDRISTSDWYGLSVATRAGYYRDVLNAFDAVANSKDKDAKTLVTKIFNRFINNAYIQELEYRYEQQQSAFIPENIRKKLDAQAEFREDINYISDRIDYISEQLEPYRVREDAEQTEGAPFVGVPLRATIIPITEETIDIDERTGKPKPRTKEIGYKIRYGKEELPGWVKDKQEAQSIAESLNAKKEAIPSSEGWMNLALKQIALMAVDGGFDKVAFVDWRRSYDRFPIQNGAERVENRKSTFDLFSTIYGDTTGNQANKAMPSMLKQGLGKLLKTWNGNLTTVQPNIDSVIERRVTETTKDFLVGEVLAQPEKISAQATGMAEDVYIPQGTVLTQEMVDLLALDYERSANLGREILVKTDGFFDALGFDVTPAMRDKISQGLPYMYGKSGSYDPRSDTIILDPELGMNAHTFIHEVVHAAISNVLRNTSHPLTKEFEKFFVSIKDRLGSAYGATDLQEFAAELISNPSFQALLKSIKTPRSENLFQFILRKIAEFFGFAKDTTAFTQGLKFINAAIDVTEGMEAVPGEKMFFGMGDFSPIGMAGKAMPALVGRTVENARNTLSNLGGGSLLEEALGALRLDNLRQIYKQLPSIDTLQDALEKRMGQEEADIKRINDKYMKFVGVQQKHPEQMRLMDDLSIRASQAEVDITKSAPEKTTDPKRVQDHKRLRDEYLKINPEVREVYESIRKDYDDAFKRYRKIIEDAAEGQPGLAAQLREEFETRHPLTGYVPFLRRGDYWLEFTSPETDSPVVMAFDSIRERDLFVAQNLKGIPNRKFQRFEDIQYNADNIPPTHFISKVITGLRQKNASQEQINSVYQAYLAAFPAESMAKQFMKRRGVEGMDKDLVRGYGDLMVKWTRKLVNSEYTPQIDRALMQIAQEATDQPPDVAAAARSILRQKAFFHNPSYGKWVSAGTALSYYEFMAGNISSGIINLTSLPLMVFPMLTGRFNPISAGSAILSAMKESLPGNNWQNDPKYKKLYDTLMDHAQLEHTMAREVLEGRRQKTGDYTGRKAKFTELVSLPFSVSEKWNRATTAIAAFNLAKGSGMSEEKAIRYALETVRTAHTSGMAATSSRWLQTPFGRLFGTFKSIIWQQAYVIARAFHQAAKGADPKTRKAARHQLLAMYGMATVFVGAKGMPFYGAMSVLAEMLNTMFGDDDEPFDFDEFMRDLLPMFLYKGLINYSLNLEVANRAGLATDIIFRDDPYGVAKHGYVRSALMQAFGPLGSIAGNAERSITLFKDGEYARSFEASLPSALRNVLKSVRYMNEGATTLDGEPIMENISAYNNLMQVIGFAPADLSNRYEMLQAAKGFEREILQRRQKALRMIDMALTAGDMDAFQEAMERVQNFNEANPDFAITANSIQRSQRARRAAEKDSVYGTRFNKNLVPRIREEFFEDEE